VFQLHRPSTVEALLLERVYFSTVYGLYELDQITLTASNYSKPCPSIISHTDE